MSQTADLSSGFDTTLREFGFAVDSLDARAALGKLVALELVSYLGFRQARRVLTAERHAVLDLCARAVIEQRKPDDGIDSDG
jgi:hypothetical protein